MSISLIQEPAELSFSRNPVVFQLKTDALYKQVGKPFIGKLFIDFFAPDFFTFTLAYADQKLQFTVAPNADDSGYQLPARGNTPSAEAWMNQIAAALNGCYTLNRDFAASVDGNGTDYWVVITARKPGALYAITGTGPTDGYFGFSQLQASEERIPNLNFKIYYELWAWTPDGGVPAKQCQVYLEPDDNGLVNIDLSEQLTDVLTYDGFETPDFINKAAFINTRSICRYYLRYAEVYGSAQAVRQLKDTAIRTAILGGISKEMLAGSAFPGYFTPNGQLRFLQQTAADRYILPEQAEFLTLVLFKNAVGGVRLRFVLRYVDGSADEVINYVFGYQDRYTKLTFPVGFLQNSLHTKNGNRVVQYYTVTALDDANNFISETRTYRLDYGYYPYNRQFIYLNSFGGLDTLVTYGKGSTQYDLTLQNAEKVSAKGFDLAKGELVSYAASLAHSESVASGYRSKAEVRLFRDLALSRNILLFRKQKVYAVGITSKSIKEFKDGSGLYAISFEFGYLFSDELYTVDDQDDHYQPFLIQ